MILTSERRHNEGTTEQKQAQEYSQQGCIFKIRDGSGDDTSSIGHGEAKIESSWICVAS